MVLQMYIYTKNYTALAALVWMFTSRRKPAFLISFDLAQPSMKIISPQLRLDNPFPSNLSSKSVRIDVFQVN